MDPTPAAWEVIVVVWVISGVIASLIWQHKGGKPWSGFWLGLVLGLIGVVYVTVADPKTARWSADAWSPADAAYKALHPPDPPPPPPAPGG